MKKMTGDGEDLLGRQKIFCTECGAELENFCFSSGSKDVEAIKKTLAQCRKKGKTTGDFCSKLFIADDRNLDSIWDDD